MGSSLSKSSKHSKGKSKNPTKLPSSSYGSQNEQPAPEHLPTGGRICAGCNTKIEHGRRYKSSLNAFWHPKCFCCHACHEPISNYEFIPCGSSFFHKSCYGHYYPMCDVCKNFIQQPYTFGGVPFQGHAFWSQNLCTFHEDDGTPSCCSCKRMMPRDTSFNLEDEGRNLCLECLDTAIMDTNEARPLYIDIQRFYQGLDMKLHRKISLRLVGNQEMRESLREPAKIVPYGLCPTRSTRKSNPRIEATRILVLFGFPRLFTGTVIAHEMMHAWMAQEGYPILDQVIEEGMCDVMANMWLEAELSSLSHNNFISPYNKRKIGEYLKHRFESDTVPDIYVDGFRQGQRALSKYGLQRTLELIRKTKNFPS